MTRVKKTVEQLPAIESRAELETFVGALCGIILERDQLTNAMNQKLLDVRQDYEGRLIPMEGTIKTGLERLETWAAANPAEFGGKKSLDLLHGTIGFRTCPPALKTIKGWTWKLVIAALKKIESMKKYVREKSEVDKETLLAERATLPEGTLKLFGMHVDQGEQFFVDPKADQAGGQA